MFCSFISSGFSVGASVGAAVACVVEVGASVPVQPYVPKTAQASITAVSKRVSVFFIMFSSIFVLLHLSWFAGVQGFYFLPFCTGGQTQRSGRVLLPGSDFSTADQKALLC